MAGALGTYWKSIARGRAFSVRAVARGRRDEAIARVEEAVQRRRGDILDFKMFSNVSLNLLVELDGSAVAALLDELAALGWPVEVEPGREALSARGGERLGGTLQVTFPEGDGELVIPLPRVPG
jgi:hypothetical protein